MKEYINRTHSNIVHVVFMDDHSVVYEEFDGTRRYSSYAFFSDYYREYKEPRRLEGWVNVYTKQDGTCPSFGRVQESEYAADSALNNGFGTKKVGMIKIEWVEGQT